MTLIEKLEQLQRYEQGRHGEMQKAETYHSAKYISEHDLLAIIEEYKNAQEPVGYVNCIMMTSILPGHTYTLKLTYDDLMIDIGKIGKVGRHNLFTHPPLSDETVKDAARWNKLISYVGAQKTEWGGQIFHLGSLPIPDGVNLMQGGVSGHLTKIIDEAMKAANETKGA